MQQEQNHLTANELNILNVLLSLGKDERITIPALSNYTGISERVCYKCLEGLRSKSYKVVSDKSKATRGTWIARNNEEWERYLARRTSETNSSYQSINKMR